MDRKSIRRAPDATRRALVYIRYLFPIFAAALCVAVMFVPCLSYSTVEGTQASISLSELIGNSWDQVRAYLFATAQQEPSQKIFAQTVLALIVVFVLLFVIGVASAVVSAVFAIRYFNAPKPRTVAHMWFITIIPNRAVLCALYALTLPLLFFCRLIIPLYDRIMHVDVLLNVSAPEPWVWGLILYGVSVVLSVVSARYERQMRMDMFKQTRAATVRVSADAGVGEEYVPHFETEADRENYEMIKRSKQEQAERIRKLLDLDDSEEK